MNDRGWLWAVLFLLIDKICLLLFLCPQDLHSQIFQGTDWHEPNGTKASVFVIVILFYWNMCIPAMMSPCTRTNFEFILTAHFHIESTLTYYDMNTGQESGSIFPYQFWEHLKNTIFCFDFLQYNKQVEDAISFCPPLCYWTTFISGYSLSVILSQFGTYITKVKSYGYHIADDTSYTFSWMKMLEFWLQFY